METSWLGGRVPLPELEEIIEGTLEPVAKPMGPNARFGYPLKGGFQALMNGFLPHIRGKIELNADVAQLLPREHLIALADGRRWMTGSGMPAGSRTNNTGNCERKYVTCAMRRSWTTGSFARTSMPSFAGLLGFRSLP